MKIYRVIYTSIYLDEGENITEVKTFLKQENALNYMKKEIEEIKKQVDALDDYCIDENETSYERYLEGRACEDSVAIWIEEDETYDEKFLEVEQDLQNNKDYEM